MQIPKVLTSLGQLGRQGIIHEEDFALEGRVQACTTDLCLWLRSLDVYFPSKQNTLASVYNKDSVLLPSS